MSQVFGLTGEFPSHEPEFQLWHRLTGELLEVRENTDVKDQTRTSGVTPRLGESTVTRLAKAPYTSSSRPARANASHSVTLREKNCRQHSPLCLFFLENLLDYSLGQNSVTRLFRRCQTSSWLVSLLFLMGLFLSPPRSSFPLKLQYADRAVSRTSSGSCVPESVGPLFSY